MRSAYVATPALHFSCVDAFAVRESQVSCSWCVHHILRHWRRPVHRRTQRLLIWPASKNSSFLSKSFNPYQNLHRRSSLHPRLQSIIRDNLTGLGRSKNDKFRSELRTKERKLKIKENKSSNFIPDIFDCIFILICRKQPQTVPNQRVEH